MKNLIIIGAGAHCKVVLDIISENLEYQVVGLIDNDQKKELLGIPVIGNDNDLLKFHEAGVDYAFVAIGNNSIREYIIEKIEKIGYKIPVIVSSFSIISKHASIGKGTVVMPGAVINVNAVIGEGCIINTNASVDHDCKVGDYVHIAPGCAISGCTSIGKGSFLGTGSCVIDNIHIGNNVMLGAGAVAIKNIADNCVAVGVPAVVKKIRGSQYE